nr:restriction endonuclease subunit S [Acinetobacter sp.]
MTSPKLRFKEFDGDFSKKTIKDIAQIYVGRDLVEDAYSPIKTEQHVSPIYSNSVDNEGLYGYYNFEEFNFLDDALTVVGRGAGLGKAFYRQGGFGTIGRLLCLAPKDKSFHPKYLSDYINDKLVIHNESGGIPQLPRSSLEGYEVTLPEYEEQTKIASFLSAVDEKINQLTKKHELLSQYKQGMMQKLFSQQIRFKADDGSEFGEWQETTLGEVVKFSNSKRIPLSEGERQKRQGDYRYYGASGVIDYVDDYLFDGEYILIGEDGANILTRSSPLAFIVEGQFWVNNHAHIFQSKQGNNLFLATYLESLNYEKFNSGTAQPKLNLENLKKVSVINPCLEEQNKIANFLSAIDQKIEVVAQQIEQAKQWKRGLLQQMFV